MLELINITKEYAVGDDKVKALKGVTLGFRENGLISILGQSGCGKTTLLNIIGGLDRYTDGDLIIDGRSTKYFKAADWDAYRNRKIGFVFQSYNLIPHLTVLGNVELALTLSGVKKSERRARAIEALRRVGLESEIKKRPNQMSGGQMQRVAIARALVNDPEIILADEPTGALDSNTSVQVMEILKEIAGDRLVVMVTHNGTLAERYSTRIISMLDGRVINDTAPVELVNISPQSDGERQADNDKPADGATQNNTAAQKCDGAQDGTVPQKGEGLSDAQAAARAAKADKAAAKQRLKEQKREQRAITKANRAAMKRTSMSFFTAFGLSARNLVTKKGRTIATAIAGSIGIIGVALVLALSNGFNGYIADLQTSMLASYPVTVSQTTVDLDSTIANMENGGAKLEQFPDGTKLIINVDKGMMTYHYNRITPEYLEYLDGMPDGYAIDILRDYAQNKVVLSDNGDDGTIKRITIGVNNMFGMGTSNFTQLLNNSDYVMSQYDYWGKYPTEYDEIAMVVGRDNSINLSTINAAGLKAPEDYDNATFDDLIGQELTLVTNDNWFTLNESSGVYQSFNENSTQEEWRRVFDADGNITLKVVGVMRIKESAALALYSSGLVYTPALNQKLIEDGKNSAVGKAQAASRDKCVTDAFVLGTGQQSMQTAGLPFSSLARVFNMAAASVGLTVTADDLYLGALQSVGASDIPTTVNFYPVSFERKSVMLDYLNKYNADKPSEYKILPLDAAAVVTDSISEMIDIISYVLIAFAAISLVVSSVMISIITYASVVERTKEIGVLRAVGARKIDIMRVFNAETMIIGFVAGLIGVLVTLILSFPLSSLFIKISDGMVKTSLVVLAWWHALLLIAISVLLTFIAGMLPSMSAAKRDPVVALRSD